MLFSFCSVKTVLFLVQTKNNVPQPAVRASAQRCLRVAPVEGSMTIASPSSLFTLQFEVSCTH